MSARAQCGFTLLEALVAIALLSGAAIAGAGAAVRTLHGLAIADTKMRLCDDALNVLADVRSLTAYDRDAIGALERRTSTVTLRREGTKDGTFVDETISLQLFAGTAPDTLIVRAVVSEGDVHASEQQTISWEAPAPGSVVVPAPDSP